MTWGELPITLGIQVQTEDQRMRPELQNRPGHPLGQPRWTTPSGQVFSRVSHPPLPRPQGPSLGSRHIGPSHLGLWGTEIGIRLGLLQRQ